MLDLKCHLLNDAQCDEVRPSMELPVMTSVSVVSFKVLPLSNAVSPKPSHLTILRFEVEVCVDPLFYYHSVTQTQAGSPIRPQTVVTELSHENLSGNEGFTSRLP